MNKTNTRARIFVVAFMAALSLPFVSCDVMNALFQDKDIILFCQQTSDTSVRLSWNSIAGASEYWVKRTVYPDEDHESLQLIHEMVWSTSFVDKDFITPGQTIAYSVLAMEALGNDSFIERSASDIISVYIKEMSPVEIPRPTGLSATIARRNINLEWDEGEDPHAWEIQYFVPEYYIDSPESGEFSLLNPLPITESSYAIEISSIQGADSIPSENPFIYFRIKSVMPNLKSSPWSAPIRIRVE